MTDRIRTLVKRISETRPVQSARRQSLLQELRALRNGIDAEAAPDQTHSLDAALLLMEFMNRSEDVATAETLQIVASLVGTIDEGAVRPTPGPVQFRRLPGQSHDVAEHRDLRMTQEFLLGSILLQAGVISPESLARALQLHASSHLALGQCLIQLGAASPEQIASAVSYQDRLREDERATRAEPARPAHANIEMHLSAKQRGFVQSMHAQVLGEVLIRLGTITREQLERALQVQRAASLHIGEALVETGAATWDQIRKGLEVQKQLRRRAA
jgi:hypothetical protein